MARCPMKSTDKSLRSSTPNHSLVPSVATAAVEETIAGITPAAAAKGVRDASNEVLVTPNGPIVNNEKTTESELLLPVDQIIKPYTK